MQSKSVAGKRIKDTLIEDLFGFPLYVITNPFKAFGDIKYEKKGSVKACVFFMFILMILTVMRTSYTGVIFIGQDPRYANIWITMIGVLIQTLLIVVANWSVTVLMNGSGSFREIFMVASYAQYPYLWLSVLYILLSHVLSLDEGAILSGCMVLGVVCIVFYGFVGLVTVHGFGFFKGIASIFLTIVALAVIIFVLLLLVSMGGELISFINTVYNEIVLHYF